MEFDTFFFLHIDKTIGRLTYLFNIEPMFKHLNINNINTKKYNSSHEKHNKMVDVDDKTYIFSTFRNPIERTISEFCYNQVYNENQYKFTNERDAFSKSLSIENFMNWIESEYISNFQYKSLNGKIDRINLFIKSESINNKSELLHKKIYNDLGIIVNKFYNYYDPEATWYSQNIGEFYLKINPDIIKKIEQYNEIDLDIYKSNIFTTL